MHNLLKNLGSTKTKTKINKTPKEIVELYLAKRGFEEIEEGDYSHFTFVDSKDETLGDYTECDVLLNFLVAESDDEIEEFEMTTSQITKLRQSVLAYMSENPNINDCRLDMLYLIMSGEDGKVEIRHEIGTVRLMLLSKD